MYQLGSGSGPRGNLGEGASEFEWSRLWSALQRRRRLFGLVALGSFLAIAAYTLLVPRSYTTHVKLIAGNGNASANSASNANTSLPLLNALLAATGVQTSETYAELFQENPVASQVITELQLPTTPANLLSHVKVQPIVNTTLLDLAVSWSNPEMSATIANAFAGAFVDHERALVGNQADEAIKTLNGQVPGAQAIAGKAEAALTQFQSRNDMADLQTQTQNTMNAAAALDAKISATEVDREQAAAQLASVATQLGHVGPTVAGQTTVAPNPVLGQLQQQLSQVTVQLQVAQQQYTDQHPTVIGLRRQQSELQREIAHTPATIVSQASTMPNPVFVQLDQQAAISRAQVASDAAELVAESSGVVEIPLIVHVVNYQPAAYLPYLADALKAHWQGVVVLVAVEPGKVGLLASVSPAFTKKIQAGKIIQAIAPLVGGKGGGRPELAQGGGTNPDGVPAALEKVQELVRAA